ncbi:uncharacterized protein LOC110106204 isoform X3 [Dendrobium catenatum]|uniref:uncharacterized protein LOC110106204 isoform X3 n=1 Tax=Dendrobium catenatum TaxID=906689 RepID=UPI0009F71045|nr:uncharacterized protein LOC110106204 isoform X3 [Dendrobium catenatum]
MAAEEEKENMSRTRWLVTYTKHMKQKRKVYQDGVMELCSSSGKPQVILYDDCKKLIDKRFLKKDDIVKSGGTLSFETHMVEIGDPDRNNKPSAESNLKSVIRSKPQKEKITLLTEDGAVLSSKYLTSVACLETGKNCEFPNYLVEICEKRTSAAGQDGHSNFPSCKDLHMKDSMNQVVPSKPEKFNKAITYRKARKIPLSSAPKKETGCRTPNARSSAAPSNLSTDLSKKVTNNCESKLGSFISSSSAPLRDAGQILSVVKRPSPDGSLVLLDPFEEQGFTSQSSDKNQLDLQMSSEKTGTSSCHGLKSANSQKDSMLASQLVLDADSEGITSENDRASSIWSSGSVVLDTPTKSSINNTEGHTGLAVKASEVLGVPMLSGSGQTNKPDKALSDVGFSIEVINEMNPIFPMQNPLGVLNGKQHLSSSSILLKDNLDAHEKSTLHDERNESVSFAIAASTVHATSDVTKDFPVFDLGL